MSSKKRKKSEPLIKVKKRSSIRGVTFRFDSLGNEKNHARKFGVKYCNEKDHRDRAFARQKKGFKSGIAPPVGKKVRVKIGHGPPVWNGKGRNMYYGYMTGIAEMAPSYYYNDDEYDNLYKKLDKMGLTNDLHSQNIGRWKDEYVLIDFDDHCDGSTEDSFFD